MSRNHKPVAIAIGAALAGGLTLAGSAFAMQPLASGYMVAGASVAEGSCGADKAAKAEGKCGLEAMDADKDGRVSRAEFTAMHADGEAMFAMHDADKDGFLSAAEAKAHMEGMRGGDHAAPAATQPMAGQKAGMEGKCGEGKCGSN